MQAYKIQCLSFDYTAHMALTLIRYYYRQRVLHDAFTSQGDPIESEYTNTMAFLLKIEFRNTSVLYCEAGYKSIDGNFEVVNYKDLKWLVSPHPFLCASTVRPIHFVPLRLDRPHSPKGHVHSGMPTVSVIIPIYGSPRNTLDIRNQINEFLPELKSLNGRVIISVDGHDSALQNSLHIDILEELDPEFINIYYQEKNLGFIKNVNFLFRKTRSDEIVILLTTDVKMPPATFTRIIAPLVSDNNIALSTPFAIGGENLEAPDSQVLYWRDLDTILFGDEPSYPDAETNVGYLLAVDRRKYRGDDLFDEFFVNGYGDDSDLYYRCINIGLRGVVVDNCCVFHEHGASFSLTQARSKLRIENHRRFTERWGEAFEARHGSASAALNELKARKSRLATALVRSLPTPHVVFFLPTNDRRIGGVAAVFDLVEALCEQGVPAAVISRVMPFNEFGLPCRSIPYEDASRRDLVLAGASVLIATSHDTCEPVKGLAGQYGLKTAYFVQGPEFSFSDGQFLSSVVTGYGGFDSVFVVSRYLEDVIADYIDKPITLIPYGPPLLSYYELGTPREPNSIAVQMNGNPNKGAAYVAGVVASLARHGFRIYSFGDDSLRGRRQNFCDHLGFLSIAEKVRLFNRVEFYLDASNFEGLGLLLMESIRCGSIPLYRHNGGTADILKSSGAGIEIGDYAAIRGIRQQLMEFRNSADFDAERRRCKMAIAEHSREAAAKAMLEWWNAFR